MWDVVIDALKDSVTIFIWLFAVNFAFSFIENKIADKKAEGKAAVPLAAALGLLPQCGFSVIASERYSKRKITAGTLIAVFVATSDEAIPVFLASGEKFYLIFPVLIVKFVMAVLMGYIFDLVFKKTNAPLTDTRLSDRKTNDQSITQDTDESESNNTSSKKYIHLGCGCMHEKKHHDDNSKHEKLHDHLIHPLIHSLKTFSVVLILNLAFGFLVYFVTEERLSAFLQSNAYFSPLLAVVCGLIPNCAASVIVSDLYLAGRIPFGACLSGLTVNAGLGLTFLIKNEKSLKNKIIIIGYLVIGALLFGYIACLITGF